MTAVGPDRGLRRQARVRKGVQPNADGKREQRPDSDGDTHRERRRVADSDVRGVGQEAAKHRTRQRQVRRRDDYLVARAVLDCRARGTSRVDGRRVGTDARRGTSGRNRVHPLGPDEVSRRRVRFGGRRVVVVTDIRRGRAIRRRRPTRAEQVDDFRDHQQAERNHNERDKARGRADELDDVPYQGDSEHYPPDEPVGGHGREVGVFVGVTLRVERGGRVGWSVHLDYAVSDWNEVARLLFEDDYVADGDIAGADAVAAYGIGTRVTSLVVLPALGLARGTETVVGQNLGAKQAGRAKRAVLASTGVTAAVLAVASIGIYVSAPSIIGIFITGSDAAAVIEIGAGYLRIVGSTYVFLGVFHVIQGAYRGSGSTRLAMLFGILGLILLRVPPAYALLVWTDLGATGVWYGIAVANVVMVLLTGAYAVRGTWSEGIVDSKQISIRTK